MGFTQDFLQKHVRVLPDILKASEHLISIGHLFDDQPCYSAGRTCEASEYLISIDCLFDDQHRYSAGRTCEASEYLISIDHLSDDQYSFSASRTCATQILKLSDRCSGKDRNK